MKSKPAPKQNLIGKSRYEGAEAERRMRESVAVVTPPVVSARPEKPNPFNGEVPPDFYSEFLDEVSTASDEEREWCVKELFGEIPYYCADGEPSRERAFKFRVSVDPQNWRRVTRFSMEQQRAFFCATPPAEGLEGDTSTFAERNRLTDEERAKLIGILFDIRTRKFDDARLARWTARQRLEMGSVCESLAGELDALVTAIWKAEDMISYYSAKNIDPTNLRIIQRIFSKQKADCVMRAGEIVVEAMRRGDADAFKGIFNFLSPPTTSGSRNIKIKRGAGRGWGAGDIKTTLPVALDRVLRRRCPAMAKGDFTSDRITNEEIIEALKAVQDEVRGQVEVGIGIDNAELSKWIKRLQLRPFMRESDTKLARKKEKAQSKKIQVQREREELQAEQKRRRKSILD